MNKNKAIIILLAAIFLTAGIISIAHFFYSTLAVIEYKSTIIVGDHYGFAVDADVLSMGMVTPGESTNTRDLIITNTYDFPVTVTFKRSGEMKDWLRMPDSIVIEGNKTENVRVSAHVPRDVPYGNYNGTLTAIFTRA